MNALTIFKNENFGELGVIVIDDKPLFPATEVAKMLGYSNPLKAVRDHCLTEGVTKRSVLTQGGIQTKNFISEGNLYRLITKSKLPSAEKFEKWVFDEVLPEIRRTGKYDHKGPSQTINLLEVNQAAQIILNAMRDAEISPADRLKTVSELYRPLGIMIPDSLYATQTSVELRETSRFYSANDIAELLGVYTVGPSSKPHAWFVGALLKTLTAETVSLKARGRANAYYTSRAIDTVKDFLERRRFPRKVKLNQEYQIRYR